MDTNSLVHRVKVHLKCNRQYCTDYMGMRMMVHNSNLDSSYSNNDVLVLGDVVVVDDAGVDSDNSMDYMDTVMDMDKYDLDRLVAVLLVVFSSPVLDDKRTMDEIHEYVAVALHLSCLV